MMFLSVLGPRITNHKSRHCMVGAPTDGHFGGSALGLWTLRGRMGVCWTHSHDCRLKSASAANVIACPTWPDRDQVTMT